MSDSLDLYQLTHFRGCNAADLRNASILIEAEELAAEVRQLLPGATTAVALSFTSDRTEAVTSVDYASDEGGVMRSGIVRETVLHLLGELRRTPGEPGVRRFLAYYPYGYL